MLLLASEATGLDAFLFASGEASEAELAAALAGNVEVAHYFRGENPEILALADTGASHVAHGAANSVVTTAIEVALDPALEDPDERLAIGFLDPELGKRD